MDSGKAEGREAGPVADEESSVESGRQVSAGGQEDIAEGSGESVRQSSAAGPKFGRGAPWRSRPPKSRHMSEGHGGVNKSLRLPGFIGPQVFRIR